MSEKVVPESNRLENFCKVFKKRSVMIRTGHCWNRTCNLTKRKIWKEYFSGAFSKNFQKYFCIVIIITFIHIQEKGFTESLSNWKTSTGPNSAQLPFLCVIIQTLETVNVDLELDYLHL